VPFIDLVVSFPDAEDFKYQAYPVAYSVPSFAANLATVRDVYYRIEIFSRTGSRGRDIMGYTKDQVISDVLDAYDAHIMYLTMSDEIGTATGTIPVTAPDHWDDADHVDTEIVGYESADAEPASDHPTDPAARGGRASKENHD
jgi:choline/glycine/proline betaine transport protein